MVHSFIKDFAPVLNVSITAETEEKLIRRTNTSGPGKSGKNPVIENQRRRGRVKAVLPVRVSGSDGGGNGYTDLAHTLDITETGVRLGAVRRELEIGTQLTLQYKQHKAEFRVVWTESLPKLKEHQVGLEAVVQRDMWGLGAEQKSQAPSNTQSQSQAPQADHTPARPGV
ncbi:MAG: PilZ domain-containing protein [Terriglobales bacterium]